MTPVSFNFEEKMNQTERQMRLCDADWKVWFLGGGCGGAMGLCILAIILTLNGSSSAPWMIAAWRVTMFTSSVCTLLLAFTLQNFSSLGYGASSLFILSFMQSMMAITLPMFYAPRHLQPTTETMN
jgi:hypothetical protein